VLVVALGALGLLVAEEPLDLVGVDPGLVEDGRRRRPEGVGVSVPVEN